MFEMILYKLFVENYILIKYAATFNDVPVLWFNFNAIVNALGGMVGVWAMVGSLLGNMELEGIMCVAYLIIYPVLAVSPIVVIIITVILWQMLLEKWIDSLEPGLFRTLLIYLSWAPAIFYFGAKAFKKIK